MNEVGNCLFDDSTEIEIDDRLIRWLVVEVVCVFVCLFIFCVIGMCEKAIPDNKHNKERKKSINEMEFNVKHTQISHI